MVIIGEKLNSSIPRALGAFNAKDEDFVRTLAAMQLEGGAQYLDVNAAMCENEREMLLWILQTAGARCNFVVDSPNPDALKYVYDNMELPDSIINSVTLEQARLDAVLPIVKEFQTGIVAMPIDDGGMPQGTDTRVENASRLIETLRDAGVADGKMYVDIIVEAAGAVWHAPGEALAAARILRGKYPEVHLLVGLSNVSFGLPGRAALNQAFLCMCIGSGVDSAILDSANDALMLSLRAAELMAGKDEFCMAYLSEYRKQQDA